MTLFPYTTLFRSVLILKQPPTSWENYNTWIFYLGTVPVLENYKYIPKLLNNHKSSKNSKITVKTGVPCLHQGTHSMPNWPTFVMLDWKLLFFSEYKNRCIEVGLYSITMIHTIHDSITPYWYIYSICWFDKTN